MAILEKVSPTLIADVLAILDRINDPEEAHRILASLAEAQAATEALNIERAELDDIRRRLEEREAAIAAREQRVAAKASTVAAYLAGTG